MASLLPNWCVWSSALVQQEDILLICSSRSQSCGSEVFAAEQATPWNFPLFLHSQFRLKSHSPCIRRQLTSLSLLRSLSWIPCMVNSCDSNPRNAPSLLFKVAHMSHPQSQIEKGIHPNISHIEPATQQQFVSRNLPFKHKPSYFFRILC